MRLALPIALLLIGSGAFAAAAPTDYPGRFASGAGGNIGAQAAMEITRIFQAAGAKAH